MVHHHRCNHAVTHLCSYKANNCPHVFGDKEGNSSDSEGRLPGNSIAGIEEGDRVD